MIATPLPVPAGFAAASAAAMPSSFAVKACSFASNVAAPALSAFENACSISSASFFIVGMSYQTCSLSSPSAGFWSKPEMSTALRRTGLLPPGSALIIVSTKSS